MCCFCKCFQLPFQEPMPQQIFSLICFMSELKLIYTATTLPLQAAAGSSPARASQTP